MSNGPCIIINENVGKLHYFMLGEYTVWFVPSPTFLAKSSTFRMSVRPVGNAAYFYGAFRPAGLARNFQVSGKVGWLGVGLGGSPAGLAGGKDPL